MSSFKHAFKLELQEVFSDLTEDPFLGVMSNELYPTNGDLSNLSGEQYKYIIDQAHTILEKFGDYKSKNGLEFSYNGNLFGNPKLSTRAGDVTIQRTTNPNSGMVAICLKREGSQVSVIVTNGWKDALERLSDITIEYLYYKAETLTEGLTKP